MDNQSGTQGQIVSVLYQGLPRYIALGPVHELRGTHLLSANKVWKPLLECHSNSKSSGRHVRITMIDVKGLNINLEPVIEDMGSRILYKAANEVKSCGLKKP